MSSKNQAYYKVYDMSKQGRPKGLMMGIVYVDSSCSNQLDVTVDSYQAKDIDADAQKIAKRHGYNFAERTGRIVTM